jgi:hypothetical protein
MAVGQRRAGHQQDDDSQHPLPPDPVAEWPEYEPAEGSHEERRREDREGVQQSRGLVSGREEVRGNERGQESVDGEVEPFHRVADRCAGHCLA